MNRKEFIIKALFGIVAIPSLIESCKESVTENNSAADTCALIPEEDAGPYVLDLGGNPHLFRRDITEGKSGISLVFTFKLFNVKNNCAPIANARLDIWHCDKDGLYSGVQQERGDTTGQTFFRGIQLSDKNGHVTFKTIYPGWYQDRMTHIHFQVFLNNGLVATSQVAFPEDITHVVYDSPLYSARGQNMTVVDNINDIVFEDPESALPYELCSITPDPTTGGYNAELAVGIAV